ncbi:coagulation factor XI [Anopheles sinensis]|uniref:Coagulation factor XI n=1 Tax=Anopheles sinensis TaxID=74873 RepID=A0A084VG93_ANOSI|nr:coagulation factor XI [Anopheles sinensis]
MELNLSWLLQSRFARSFVVTILVLYVLFVQVSGQNWEHQCGARQGIVNPLMVGGKPAKITDYPWHAAVYWKIVKPHRYVCGGSIINRNTILSEFYPGSSYHDLALVAVNSSINWTEYVQPVCLWTMDEDQYRLFGSKGSVVGFGCSNSSQASDTLLEVNLTVVRDAECLMAERIYGQILTTQMFCAGGGSDVGPSSGDSGGGLLLR